ncbi:hypothetical protein PBI_PEREGRIN_226 [Rhodococcus phage Peregrin]|nr:hypothetical protein PBI_PEREGRIN_226 [Rhodococcus phage Peregrin]
MTKLTIKSEDLIAEVIKIAQANPNYVYDNVGGCHYSSESTAGGSCLFGLALFNLGVDFFTLRALDSFEDYETTIGCLADPDSTIEFPVDIIGTNEQAAAMADAQQSQDIQKPWGEAIIPLLDLNSSTD